MADDDKKIKDAEPVEAKDEAQKAAVEAEKSAEQAEKAQDQSEKASEEAKDAAQEAKKSASEEKPKSNVKVSAKLEKIIQEIEKLSVLELSELVKALEEKFGVTATAPMAVASAGTAPAAGGDEGISEQTTFNVILADGGANKISVIKAVREIVPTLGLKEAKDLVDGAPKPVVEGVNKESATEAKTKLEAAGAKVELK